MVSEGVHSLAARWAQRAGVPAAIALGVVLLLRAAHPHYPIGKWLFWRYLLAASLALVFGASSLLAGHAIVRAVMRRALPLREHLVVSFALGVAAFGLGTFAAGLLGLYGPAFFALFPIALAAPGARSALALARRALPKLRAARRRAGPTPAWLTGIWVLATIGFLLVYLPTLVPANIAYDARWYHLPIAEQYAAAGRVVRFGEGWTLGAFPQLASYLYTWAFQLPGVRAFDHVELAAHLEVVCFLGTLPSIPVLARRLLPGVRARGAWAVLFLFPGIYLYDSNLATGADHVLALFAAPIWILLLRAWRDLEARASALFALAAAGAFLTKYTGTLLVAPAVLAFGVRALVLLVRRRTLRGPLVALGTFVAATAPHWLKNAVFYGDPFYPLSNGVLHTLRPWSATAQAHYEGFALTVLARAAPGWEGWKETLRTGATFAFEPHDWWYMHGQVPVFGFLFTLLVLPLPFLGKRARLWGIAIAVELAVMLWFRTHHFDRYLQALVPWMAAFVAVVLALCWRAGAVARAAVVGLVALQIAWGGDVPFMPHAMFGGPALRKIADHLATGYQKNYDDRLYVSDLEPVSAALPKDAVVLLHDLHLQLGLGRRTVNDWSVYEGGLDYARLATPRGVYEALRALGVTHVLWIPGTYKLDNDSLAGVISFWRFVHLHTLERRAIGGHTFARLPPGPPPAEAPPKVAYLGCGQGGRASGLYELADLTSLYTQPKAPPREPEPTPPDALVDRVDVVVVEDCRPAPPMLAQRFTQVFKRDKATIFLRATPGALPAAPAKLPGAPPLPPGKQPVAPLAPVGRK